jgi:hypothetical protein
MRPLPKLFAAFALALVACCFVLLGAGDAQAAIAFRASSTAETGAGAATLTINTPAGTASGDVMIATVNTVGALPSAPSGWSAITTTTNPGWTGNVVTYYKVAGAGEPASYSWGLGSTAQAAGAIAGYSGVDNTYPIGASAATTVGSSTTASTPTVSTLAVNSLVIANATWQRATGNAAVSGGGTNPRANIGSSSNPREGVDMTDFSQAAAGPTPAQSFTAGVSVPWATQTIALTPAGGTLSFTTTPDLPNLPGLTLDGTQRTVAAAMPNFAVDDETGSRSGWNVSVSGDNSAGKSPVFARYCPSAGGCGADAQGYPAGGASLGAGSLTLNSTGASFSGGVGAAPAIQCAASCALDVASPVKVASGAAGGASATWATTGFGASSVSLAVPTTLRTLPPSEVYRADLVWTLSTGP